MGALFRAEAFMKEYSNLIVSGRWVGRSIGRWYRRFWRFRISALCLEMASPTSNGSRDGDVVGIWTRGWCVLLQGTWKRTLDAAQKCREGRCRV